MNTNNKNHEIEINIKDIYSELLVNTKLIIISSVMVIILMFIISSKMPKQYKSEVTFIIPNNQQQNNGIMKYANVFGINNSSDINTLIKIIINSKRIKYNIGNSLKDYFIDETGSLNKSEKEEYILDKLKLKRTKLDISKENLFTLSYFSKSPNLSYQVILEYINEISSINKTLNLSANKNLINIIDPPEIPKMHFKPSKRIYIGIGLSLNIFLNICLILIKVLIKKINSTH